MLRAGVGGERREVGHFKALRDDVPTKGVGVGGTLKRFVLMLWILNSTPPPCKENICYAFLSLRHGHLLM